MGQDPHRRPRQIACAPDSSVLAAPPNPRRARRIPSSLAREDSTRPQSPSDTRSAPNHACLWGDVEEENSSLSCVRASARRRNNKKPTMVLVPTLVPADAQMTTSPSAFFDVEGLRPPPAIKVVAKKLRKSYSENDLRTIDKNNAKRTAFDAVQDGASNSFSWEWRHRIREECGSPKGILDAAHTADKVLAEVPELSEDSCSTSRSESMEDIHFEALRWSKDGALVRLPEEDEESIRLHRARQTVDYVMGQTSKLLQSSPESCAELFVWDALEMLRRIAVPGGRDLLSKSLAVAQACRAAHPHAEWLHLTGLIHSLGHVLLLDDFGAQPAWSVRGESFPVGCKHSPNVPFSHYFSSNPDRRKKVFNSPSGIYKPGCGLENVLLSWSASEYLYTTLITQTHEVPAAAFFVLRCQNFSCLRDYGSLLSGEDVANVPWVDEFRRILKDEQAASEAAQGTKGCDAESLAYFRGLVQKYFPRQIQFCRV